MANPAGGSGAHYPEDRNEFIELYNTTGDTIDLQGWRLTDFDTGGNDTLCAWTDTMIRRKYPHVRTHSTLIYPFSFALIMDPEYTDSAALGGYVQPYRLTDRLLLLRPGNTTIGSGLANTDPLQLVSRDGRDTSTFGTPENSHDSIPRDAGDGISWERVRPDAPDCDSNWFRSFVADGCTPGRINSITGYQNLTCVEVLGFPLTYQPGGDETIVVRIRNSGRVPVSDWNILIYHDDNRNGSEDGMERIARIRGNTLEPGRDATVATVWKAAAPGEYLLIAELESAGDQAAGDNRASLLLRLAVSQQSFILSAARFGPGLRTEPETLTINYCLPDNKGNLLITAQDLAGRQRALIFQGKPPARSGTISWNGTRTDGTRLASGIYLLVLEYRSGRTALREKQTVVFVHRD